MLSAQFDAALAELHPNPESLRYYANQLFKKCDLENRTLLEVGGGAGFLSFYAAELGAHVTCLEPIADGSRSDMAEVAKQLTEKLPALNIVFCDDSVERFTETNGERYDILLMNNVVNHIAEDQCRVLHEKPLCPVYDSFFRLLHRLIKPGGQLILADCARDNMLGSVGIKNPFCPTIDWTVHQNPSVWTFYLERNGFRKREIIWDAPTRFGKCGQVFLGNRLASWLTRSHFILYAENLTG